MKRFHVHVRVAQLNDSIAFYTRLFDAAPTRVEADYAKWMLDDPRINFAISTRGGEPGLDHLGFQTDTADELAALKAQTQAAQLPLVDEGQTSCCYAESDKHWIIDPQGIAWEQFHTLGSIPTFNQGEATAAGSACCTPAAPRATADKPRVRAGAACCQPGSGCC